MQRADHGIERWPSNKKYGQHPFWSLFFGLTHIEAQWKAFPFEFIVWKSRNLCHKLFGNFINKMFCAQSERRPERGRENENRSSRKICEKFYCMCIKWSENGRVNINKRRKSPGIRDMLSLTLCNSDGWFGVQYSYTKKDAFIHGQK